MQQVWRIRRAKFWLQYQAASVAHTSCEILAAVSSSKCDTYVVKKIVYGNKHSGKCGDDCRARFGCSKAASAEYSMNKKPLWLWHRQPRSDAGAETLGQFIPVK